MGNGPAAGGEVSVHQQEANQVLSQYEVLD